MSVALAVMLAVGLGCQPPPSELGGRSPSCVTSPARAIVAALNAPVQRLIGSLGVLYVAATIAPALFLPPPPPRGAPVAEIASYYSGHRGALLVAGWVGLLAFPLGFTFVSGLGLVLGGRGRDLSVARSHRPGQHLGDPSCGGGAWNPGAGSPLRLGLRFAHRSQAASGHHAAGFQRDLRIRNLVLRRKRSPGSAVACHPELARVHGRDRRLPRAAWEPWSHRKFRPTRRGWTHHARGSGCRLVVVANRESAPSAPATRARLRAVVRRHAHSRDFLRREVTGGCEVLDRVLTLGRHHLKYVRQEFVKHCAEARPAKCKRTRRQWVGGAALLQPQHYLIHVTRGVIVSGMRQGAHRQLRLLKPPSTRPP